MDLSKETWRVIPEEHPEIVADDLQVPIYRSPWMNQYRDLQASIGGMLRYMLHYHDFQRAPEDLDDMGAEILQN
jgi:hypothetical protein